MNTFIKLLTIAILILSSSLLSASSKIIGDWYGELNVGTVKLPLVFHISSKENLYSSTMDSPSQGALGIPMSETTFSDRTLVVSAPSLGIRYAAVLEDSKHIVGIFKQSGQELELVLTKTKPVKKKLKSQTPKAPYNYREEVVRFHNIEAGIELEGTLTFPKLSSNRLARAVVLISGSGPQNRNSEILGHQPFWVIAHYLSNNGIIVLRFDDRGVGKSGGQFQGSTSKDFASDVSSAVAYLKTRSEVDTNKIGLIGHSEGGFVAPMVASRNTDVAFIVMLAGTGVTGAEILAKQNELMSRQSGMSNELIEKIDTINRSVYAMMMKEEPSEQLVKEVLAEKYRLLGQSDADKRIELEYKQLATPWFQYFLKADPDQFLSKLTIPVLALNGTKDLQVDAEQNLSAIELILRASGNKNYTIKRLENLNHLFQTSITGAVSEYATNEETFSPKVLKVIKDWINSQ